MHVYVACFCATCYNFFCNGLNIIEKMKCRSSLVISYIEIDLKE